MTSKGMGGHQSTQTDPATWLTPPHILEALGRFHLDPCAAPEPRPWETAAFHIAPPQNGLFEPWEGAVWLNPPYGTQTGRWLAKLADHGRGVALIFARTETEMFFEQVWERANALLFLRGRLTFCRPDGTPGEHNSGAPSVLVAYGEVAVERLRQSNLDGHIADLDRGR